MDHQIRNRINKLESDLMKARKQRDYFRDELQKCISEKIELGKIITGIDKEDKK